MLKTISTIVLAVVLQFVVYSNVFAGYAYKINAADKFALERQPETFKINSGSGTCEFWIKMFDDKFTTSVAYATGGSPSFLMFFSSDAWYETSAFGFDDGHGNDVYRIRGNIRPAVDTWTHVALVWTSSGLQLYFDGLFQVGKNASMPDNGFNIYNDFSLGKEGFFTPGNAAIDEMCFWDRALSEAEIKGRMGSGLTGYEDGLIAYWSFNEGNGDIVHDLSPNHFDLNATVSPNWAVVSDILPLHNAVRSELYPVDWEPNAKDAHGRFLHDFSYAGYRLGQDVPVYSLTDPAVDVHNVATDYGVVPGNGAPPTGSALQQLAIQSTQAIQQAIDDANGVDPTVVYLPEGIYYLTPALMSDGAKAYSIALNKPNVILRGAGADKTFLVNVETNMRDKSVIFVAPEFESKTEEFSWKSEQGEYRDVAFDIIDPTKKIFVSNASGYSVGDWVVIRAYNQQLIDDHNLSKQWELGSLEGICLLRKISNITGNSIVVDIPTRYPMLKRWDAGIYKPMRKKGDGSLQYFPPMCEVGIEDFSIGMIVPDAEVRKEDLDIEGSPAYQLHRASVVRFNYVVNSWMKNVKSFEPSMNASLESAEIAFKTNGYVPHLLSTACAVDWSARLTIQDCNFQKPIFRGDGGNGYMYTISGADCLYKDCIGIDGRHNFTVNGMQASGNVMYHCFSKNGLLQSDFHRNMSPVNLFDNFVLHNDVLQIPFRPYGTSVHGYTTSQSVVWNTAGIKNDMGVSYLVETNQYDYGYVIGTWGMNSGVSCYDDDGDENFIHGTAPKDYVELEGEGYTLNPQSLYYDQLAKRLGP